MERETHPDYWGWGVCDRKCENRFGVWRQESHRAESPQRKRLPSDRGLLELHPTLRHPVCACSFRIELNILMLAVSLSGVSRHRAGMLEGWNNKPKRPHYICIRFLVAGTSLWTSGDATRRNFGCVRYLRHHNKREPNRL